MSGHDHSDGPALMTTPGRMARGLAIMLITLAIGAAVVVYYFDELFANPPPVAKITTTKPPPPPPPVAGTTTIAIPSGAQVQGNPDYVPDDAQVPLGNKVVWDNQDTAIHTATSGSPGADLGIFDTSLINGGEKSVEMEIDGKVGDVIPYYCLVHPFMTAQITIVEAEGGETGSTTGDAITIPAGAQVQGNPSYDPAEITVKQGNTILVMNADDAIHTVTSGTPDDAGSAFDTSLINPGGRSEIDTADLDPGGYDYFCLVHPFMTGKLNITE